MPGIEELIGVSIGGTVLFTVLCICGSLVFTGAAIAGSLWLARKLTSRDKETLTTGIPTTATILSLWDSGVRTSSGMNIRMGFKLQVNPPDGGEPYQAETKAMIPMVYMAQFQPGAMVRVKVHPTDPSRVELDLSGSTNPITGM